MKDLYSTTEKMKWFAFWGLEQVFGQKDGKGKYAQRKDALARMFQERLNGREKWKIRQVDTYDHLSDEDFVNNYLLPGKPVVIKGAAKDWKAVGKWSPQYFAENYPEVKQPFCDPGTRGYGFRDLPFKEIAKEIESGSKSYVKFSNFLHLMPEIENDFNMDLIERLKKVKHLKSSKQLFMGAGGTDTTIHAALANVFFVQIYGNKRWLLLEEPWTPLINPQVDRQPHLMAQEELLYPYNIDESPIFSKFGFIEVNLEPGDFYFNPAFCWHYVENKTTSIGIGFRWVPFRAIWRSPLLASIIMMSQYPPAFFQVFNNPRGKFFPKRYP